MTKILLSFLFIASFSFGQDTKWKTFKQSNVSVKYPSTWEINDTGIMGSKFLIFSPIESENDDFRENINLMIQDLKGMNISLEDYASLSVEQIKTMITNCEIFENSASNLNGRECHKFVYSGDQGVRRVKLIQYCLIVKEKAYVFTYAGLEDDFEKFEETVEAIFQTVKLK